MKKFEQLIAEGKIFDSHCHLGAVENPDLSVKTAYELGVAAIIDMATDLPSAETSVARSLANPEIVFATAGIHPEFLVPHTDLATDQPWNSAKVESEFEKLKTFVELNRANLIMLGECGLDWYWLEKAGLSDDQIYEYKNRQIGLFEKQVELSINYDLPLSIHIREAFIDGYNIINKYPKARGVFHSFTNDYHEAKQILDRDFYIGINGIATYKSAEVLRQTIIKIMGKVVDPVPADFYKKGIVFETDSPYLRPSNATTKDKFNEPQNILKVYEYITKLIS